MTTIYLEQGKAPTTLSLAKLRKALARARPLLLIIFFTLLYRAIRFGDPVIAPDEQLYLLVGDRMLQGQLPYVDLWDRKPIGLFLFYAAVRLLGGDGIVQYQIVAALCVAATASLIWIIARRSANQTAALILALCYVVTLPPLQGAGGQAPVIYNLLMIIGAWACLRAGDEQETRNILPFAMLAMVVSGIAIQFKYTPVVEGALFGCFILWHLHRCRTPPLRIVAIASAMIVVALIPTIAALGYYFGIGEFGTYVHANFTSIFERAPFPVEKQNDQRWIVLFVGGPLLVFGMLAAWALRPVRGNGEAGDYAFLLGWSLAAIAGFGLLGNFYDFYFITVLPPVLVLIAPLLRTRLLGIAITGLLLVRPMLIDPAPLDAAPRRRAQIDKLVTVLRPFVSKRCLYVFDGPATLYLLTNACAPTRYIYPDHLQNPVEAPALGVAPAAEVARILLSKPGAIVTADQPMIPRYNREVKQMLDEALARDYRVIARIKVDRVYDVHVPRSTYKDQASKNAP